MAPRSRRRFKTNNEIRAWFKRFVPTSDPENPRTLPLPDEELFKYSKTPRRSGRVAARYDDFETIEYQQQLSLQPYDNRMSNDYPIYKWNDSYQSASLNQPDFRQMSESSEKNSDDDDEYRPQEVRRTISAARTYSVQRPPPAQSTSSSSSQVSPGAATKRKYRLKKDKEREDPEYRAIKVQLQEKRDKNNEAVERSREKKKRQEREEKEKSSAMREIIKMMMRKEGEEETNGLANSLDGKHKIVFNEIFHETFSRVTRSRQNTAPNRY